MIRFLAYFLSVIFHPLLIVTYMLIILLMVNPYPFGVNTLENGMDRVLFIFFPTFLFPAFAIFLMERLQFISSIELKNREDRIIPMIAVLSIYLPMFYFVYNDGSRFAINFKACFLGAIIGLFIAFFLNLFSKVSLHGIGMGGLLALVVIILNQTGDSYFLADLGFLGIREVSYFSLLIFTILVCGLVGSSRLILDAHEPKDLYGGFLVGFSTQFIALGILT